MATTIRLRKKSDDLLYKHEKYVKLYRKIFIWIHLELIFILFFVTFIWVVFCLNFIKTNSFLLSYLI